MPEVSIIILNWNTREMLRECLHSIQTHAGDVDVEIIVVDNFSSDGSPAMVRQDFPKVRLLANQENVGFARGNNQGVAMAHGDFVLLLNSDALLTPGAVQTLLKLARAKPKAGMIGARLLNTDQSFQASFTPIPDLMQEFLILSGLGRLFFGRSYPSHGAEVEKGAQQVGYVEGACMLLPRAVYLQVGGLDEGYFMYAEDVDLCFAIHRHGYQVWYHPDAQIIHVGGGSSKNRKPQREADLYKSRIRFFRKHYGNFQAGALKAMIYFFTVVKNAYHGFLRIISGGRLGRQVVSLRQLAATLNEV